MRKSICGVLKMAVLLGVLFYLCGTKEALAEVNVNINIGPPPIVVAAPPEVVLIPGLQVYFVPQLEFDVFFHSGYWWSPRGDLWYRSKAYNGPWGLIKKSYIPAPVYKIPKNYRNLYEKEKRIPYGQWKKQGKHQGKEERKGKQKDNKPGRGRK